MSKKRDNENKKGKKSIIDLILSKTKFKDTYIGYNARLIIFTLLFFVLFAASAFLVINSLTVSDEKIISYRENGSLDYKVYLKQNNFYETPYLGRDMNYVASLIKSINIDFSYQFMISENVNLDYDYTVVADLKITDSSESSIFYEKEFILSDKKTQSVSNRNQYTLTKSVSIDYDYYNSIANSFKSTYGIDGVSYLTVYLKLNKNITETNGNSVLNNGNNMSVKIPLSQKSINIKLDDNGINNSNNIVTEKEISYNTNIGLVFAAILFIGAVASLLRLLELLALLFTKKSKYDKQVEKILKEYDRLIVETPTCPDLNDKTIIKIGKIEELLDARDNLKLPIMYHNLVNHQKCYFYIKDNDNIYLMTLKASDIEAESKNKSKK